MNEARHFIYKLACWHAVLTKCTVMIVFASLSPELQTRLPVAQKPAQTTITGSLIPHISFKVSILFFHFSFRNWGIICTYTLEYTFKHLMSPMMISFWGFQCFLSHHCRSWKPKLTRKWCRAQQPCRLSYGLVFQIIKDLPAPHILTDRLPASSYSIPCLQRTLTHATTPLPSSNRHYNRVYNCLKLLEYPTRKGCLLGCQCSLVS